MDHFVNDCVDEKVYAADIARDLDIFPDQSADTLARLGADIVFPASAMDSLVSRLEESAANHSPRLRRV